VDHVYEAVDKWSVPKVIVVAHSLGGVVALDLSQKLNGRLAGFVAISAAIPKNGGSFLSCLPFPQKTIMGIALRILGTQPPASAIKQSLGSDLDDKQAQKVADKFVPEPRKIYFDKVTANPPEVPSLFVKLTDDKEFSVTIQDKMISNLSAKDVIEIRSGHLPMISKPKELANILNDFRASLQNNE
jgi:pimeloyl-ACP methyl ester carboxylesterase